MNYETLYENLCRGGKVERNLPYYERHHIIPRCLGGGDEEENITNLTPREHYIAHKLLTKIYRKNPKIWYAFRMMFVGSTLLSRDKTHFKSRDYSSIQQNISKLGGCMTQSARIQQSKRMRENNPMFDEVQRAKVSETRKRKYQEGLIIPRNHTEEERRRTSDRMKRNNPAHTHPDRHFKHESLKVVVEFESGEIKTYSGRNDAARELGIPIGTMKWAFANGKPSKKHKIVSVRLQCEG